MRNGLLAAWVLAFALTFISCTPERTRVLTPGGITNAPAEKKDYQAMLQQARTRRTGEGALGEIAAGLDRFRAEKGRMPTNLAELVMGGTVKSIPAPPAGFAYAYEPRNGNIRLIAVDESGQITVPEDTFQAPTLLRGKNR